MTLDDRSGDGQAQPRMAAEAFGLGPDGMEAVEDRLTMFGRNAGPFVVDPDQDIVAHMGRGDLDQPAGGREADRIVDDIVDRSGKPAGLPHDDRAGPAGAGEGDLDVAGFAPGLPRRDQLADEVAEVDRLE